MGKNLKEEDLEKTVAGWGYRFPLEASEDIVCPYCGTLNHAKFDARGTRFSPWQNTETCGYCVNFMEGGCDGVIVYDLANCKFFFKRMGD